MDTLSKYFWILVIVFVFLIGYKVVPVYYKYFAIRGICKEQVDRFHRYNKSYINQRLNENLVKLGIPKKNRSHNIAVTDDTVYIDIHYQEVVDFYGQYTRQFVFDHRCKGVTESVY